MSFKDVFPSRQVFLMAAIRSLKNFWFFGLCMNGVPFALLVQRMPLPLIALILASFFCLGFLCHLAFRSWQLRSRLRSNAEEFAQYQLMDDVARREYFRIWM